MSERVVSLRFNVPSFKAELLNVNWKKTMSKNDHFTIYDGVYEGLGPVSVIPIYNLEKNIENFPTLTYQINKWKECKVPHIAKLYGIIPEKERFCIVFEKIAYSLSAKVSSKTIDNKNKFLVLLEVMEILLNFSSTNERILDLRMNNIFLNERGNIRIIFPCEGIHLYKEISEEDDEEIIDNLLNSEDNFLRFMAPELVIEPQYIGVINDIWMLGCLFIELFSKFRVWEGHSDNEIMKNLKNQTIPKLPNDIPSECWGIICECLNPFYKARQDIKDVLLRFYTLMSKLGYFEIAEKMQGIAGLTGILPSNYRGDLNSSNLNMTNQSIINDDPYAVRKCHMHPRQISKIKF